MGPGTTRTRPRWVTTPNLIALSFIVQLALLIYADHIDSNPEKYGGLTYTDVDWRVVSDGAKLIFGGSRSKRAEGWLIEDTGLPIGEYACYTRREVRAQYAVHTNELLFGIRPSYLFSYRPR
jgi:hypothetical protein